MQSYDKLWQRQVFNEALAMKLVYGQCNAYLQEYFGKSKNDITGS
jgi:hypothetical protein